MSLGRLHPDDLAALAEQVATRVLLALDAPPAAQPPGDRRLVSAAELAAILGVTRGYVYEHADELGAERLGTGRRARLRFDVDRARSALAPATTPAAAGIRPGTAGTPRRHPAPGSVLMSRPRERDAA